VRGELSDTGAVEVDAAHQFFSARKPGHLGLLCCLTYCLLNPNGAPPAAAAKQARDHRTASLYREAMSGRLLRYTRLDVP
jgi:hypothetical protein